MAQKKTTKKEETVAAVVEEPKATPKTEVVKEDLDASKIVTETQAESQTVAHEVAAELNAKQPKNFTAFLIPEVTYGEEAALDVLRLKLRSYKEIHPAFLAKTEEKDAFTLKRVYIPVYRQSAVVDYAWTINNKGEETSHTERREVSSRQYNGPAFFRADTFPADVKTITLAKPKQAAELYPCKHKTFSACVGALKKEVKAYAPQQRAKTQLYNCTYEIFYIPVLMATCVFEGEEYVGYVNMLNGECDAQYRVSDKLRDKANKVMAKVKTCRRFILATLFYALTFVVLSWIAFAINVELMKPWLALIIGLTCIAFWPFVCYLFCFTYKRKKLILKAVRTGKMPKAPLATLFSLFSGLIAVAEVVLFAIYIFLGGI